ncbi:hypothetical protein Tco_0937913 [Tanacetum coccineum]|uniref:Uncharacterized protein n=1 Tax=Tanacetum coccineum TaxID=301880 RepID=A0ABQ5DGK4_9ASTR
MSTFIKNKRLWKLTQLKELTFDELKTKFEKLVKSIEKFVPMETDERVKRQVIAKEEEIEKSVKKRGKIRKKKARKGIHIDKTAQDEKSEMRIDSIPTATKPPSIVDWKIIPQSGVKAVNRIIRKDGFDKIYMSFGTILKDFSRDYLKELYRLVIKKYEVNRPEEIYDRVLWGDLKTMFDPPISDDEIWSLPLQQKMINWSVALTGLATLEQTATGKEISNPLTADSLLKIISNMKSMHDVVSTKRIIAVTHVKVMKKYDYGYLEEIIIQRENQQLHKFVEGNFLRLNLCNIEDMLLLLVQKKLSNLVKDNLYDLNVALRMFTRRVVILKRVEDL